MRMRIFSQPLQTAMSSLCALCQTLPLSFVDADDDYDDLTLGLFPKTVHTRSYSNKKAGEQQSKWLCCGAE